jgi:uncharacterized protein (DUF1778 family)
MMGRMGGDAGLSVAADQIRKGQVPWTAAAIERLNAIPEFMRGMITQIAEEVAVERGHLEVNVELFEKVEALGDHPEQTGPPLDWTPEALRRLQDKLKSAPPIALEFVTDMLKRDTEDLARERGLQRIDESALTQIWEVPQERIAWSDEAWKRLMTSPDFVRSGIRKAAERRARKLHLKEIDSEHLTKFRNEAMMKAVKRIRSFGYRELTFDAFGDALEKVRRLQGNEQAEKRLAEIREYMKNKPEVGLLGEELMDRFRRYLKGEGTL